MLRTQEHFCECGAICGEPPCSSSLLGLCLYALEALECSPVEEEALKPCEVLQEPMLAMQQVISFL